MTAWRIQHGEILDAAADGLVCSANPDLNLSGGVGGAFLLKYGDQMQQYLQDYLHKNGVRSVSRGSVVVAPPLGSQFKQVAHAVAIDTFYDTSADWIAATYQAALDALSKSGCRTIAAACLGCGYGRCSDEVFCSAVLRVMTMPFPDVQQVTLITRNADLIESLASLIERVRPEKSAAFAGI